MITGRGNSEFVLYYQMMESGGEGSENIRVLEGGDM